MAMKISIMAHSCICSNICGGKLVFMAVINFKAPWPHLPLSLLLLLPPLPTIFLNVIWWPCLHLHTGIGVDHPLHLLEQSFFTVDAWCRNVERNANWQISLEIQRNPCDSISKLNLQTRADPSCKRAPTGARSPDPHRRVGRGKWLGMMCTLQALEWGCRNADQTPAR